MTCESAKVELLPLPERRRRAAARPCRAGCSRGRAITISAPATARPVQANPGDAGLTVQANGAFVLGRPQSMASIYRRVERHGRGVRAAHGPGRWRRLDPERRHAAARRTSAGPRRSARRPSRTTAAPTRADGGWTRATAGGTATTARRSTTTTSRRTRRLYDCWQSSPPHNPAIKAARSNHPGGVNALFCDGHVAFVKDSINVTTWRSLGTRSGGEVVSSDAY